MKILLSFLIVVILVSNGLATTPVISKDVHSPIKIASIPTEYTEIISLSEPVIKENEKYCRIIIEEADTYLKQLEIL